MGGHSLEARFGFPGRHGIADTELPLPHMGLNLQEGEFYALRFMT
jgi:hypothetical protein